VIETWNSGVDFIHYGKNSELTGDDREDLEIDARHAPAPILARAREHADHPADPRGA
jgi:hypothetical protein